MWKLYVTESVWLEVSELYFWVQCRGVDVWSQPKEGRSVGEGTKKKVAPSFGWHAYFTFNGFIFLPLR